MSRFVVLLVLLVAVTYVAAANRPPKCPKNQTWNICGRGCEPKCTNPVPYMCSRQQCTAAGTGGCRCNSGFVRASNNACIRYGECKGR